MIADMDIRSPRIAELSTYAGELRELKRDITESFPGQDKEATLGLVEAIKDGNWNLSKNIPDDGEAHIYFYTNALQGETLVLPDATELILQDDVGDSVIRWVRRTGLQLDVIYHEKGDTQIIRTSQGLQTNLQALKFAQDQVLRLQAQSLYPAIGVGSVPSGAAWMTMMCEDGIVWLEMQKAGPFRVNVDEFSSGDTKWYSRGGAHGSNGPSVWDVLYDGTEFYLFSYGAEEE